MHLDFGSTTKAPLRGIPLKPKNIEESSFLAHAIALRLKMSKMYTYLF